MIFEHNFTMGLKDIEKDNYIKNRAILEMLEDIGGYHSDLVGYGVNQIQKTKIAWILLGWKLHVINRPKYGQNIKIKTWGRGATKISTYRDFEIYNENNDLCAKATSKWTLINIENGKLARMTEEIVKAYKLEDKSVFESKELEKIKVPGDFTNVIEYKVARRDIDINQHMHNIYYLDLANEALPEDVYQNGSYNNVNIQCKKEIKQGETVRCKYTLSEGKHIVAIFSEDDSILHAVVTCN